MRKPAALFSIALALGIAFHAVGASANGPTKITKCGTILEPGSYVLTKNLTAAGDCLVIETGAVTIDLAGFFITGNETGTGIRSTDAGSLAAVRNGTIDLFQIGVTLAGPFSIVEGLRVVRNRGDGIVAFGTVRDNTVARNGGRGILSGTGLVSGNIVRENGAEGIFAGVGTVVSGNTAIENRGTGIFAGPGSTVSGNVATANNGFGIAVSCPANVIANTAVENDTGNLSLSGTGCKNIDNVAP